MSAVCAHSQTEARVRGVGVAMRPGNFADTAGRSENKKRRPNRGAVESESNFRRTYAVGTERIVFRIRPATK